jgi:hypothetical protein
MGIRRRQAVIFAGECNTDSRACRCTAAHPPQHTEARAYDATHSGLRAEQAPRPWTYPPRRRVPDVFILLACLFWWNRVSIDHSSTSVWRCYRAVLPIACRKRHDSELLPK